MTKIKALILNSGIGKRMGMMTLNKCKCMLEIADGITILDEQIRKLIKCGIKEICVTTGPFAENLRSYIFYKFPYIKFTFINNPMYNETNYIYSIYLARDTLKEDIVLLHGDLVFDLSVLSDVVSSKQSVMVIDSTKPLNTKDFKAVVKNNRIVRICIDECNNAFYAQPMYKLLKDDWNIWLNEISRFCVGGITQVYAEDAFNLISDEINIFTLDVYNRVCMEIDNLDDLSYARKIYKNIK